MSKVFKSFTSIFKAPKMPTYEFPSAPVIQAPPPVPVASDADTAKKVDDAVKDDAEKRRQQRGRAATILGGKGGVMGDDSGIATKKLLGK